VSTVLQEKHAIATENGEEITPEKLLEMTDGPRYELINGKLKEHSKGAQSSLVAANVTCLLGQYIWSRELGKFFGSNCGYQAFPGKPKQVRFSDGSFIARGRLPDNRAPKGHVRIAPDLALEVVSPNDTAEDVEARRIDFLSAGTKVFWVLYPESRTVHVFRHDGSSKVLTETDELHGDDALPGFQCKVAELFEEA
jgi:Uma2 family endonuclease